MRFNSAIRFLEDRVELHRRRGAPDGNKNRLKHGRYSAAAIAQRKLVRQTIRSARHALAEAVAEVQFHRLAALCDIRDQRKLDDKKYP